MAHLGTQCLLGLSQVGLQLLLEVLQNFTIQLLQACQCCGNALWPRARALHSSNNNM